jgi:hypothetical protein
MAIPISIEPLEIWFAISWVALRPEEQKRFTVEAAVVFGNPAARAAARRTYAAFPSETYVDKHWSSDDMKARKRTLPQQISSTRLGSRFDFSTTFFSRV